VPAALPIALSSSWSRVSFKAKEGPANSSAAVDE
jgi:hypothetical protein